MSTPVVLIHGMWCTGANWARMRALLEPRGYRCFAPTLPAHDVAPDQPLRVSRLGLADYRLHLERQIADQNFDRAPVLIGHSMGGLLAQQLAMQVQPTALVLLTPASASGINGVSLSNLPVFAPWLLGGRFWRNAHRPGFERACRSVFNRVSPEHHRRLHEGMVHESGRAAAEIAMWWLDSGHASRVVASQVRCPVYIVSAGQDRLTPAAVVRRTAARYPQAALRHYPDRGHWVIDDEHTDEMVHDLCGWLRPIEQRARR